ncbi:SulP family inorganic anion transporter, partial [Bacillus cereus]|uniref:SulP family inorganic anion transporter n=1 Tax=Bacillus cereus TaxID=1396 RepID=UPI002847BC4E
GIAVIILTGQIYSFLVLTDIKKHEYFIANLVEIFTHIGTTYFYNVLNAVICFFVILVTPIIFPKVSGSLVVVLISTI